MSATFSTFFFFFLFFISALLLSCFASVSCLSCTSFASDNHIRFASDGLINPDDSDDCDPSFSRWSKGEQSTAMETATSTTLQELAELNSLYKEKFGFVFLICASGRSTAEILNELQLGNESEQMRFTFTSSKVGGLLSKQVEELNIMLSKQLDSVIETIRLG